MNGEIWTNIPSYEDSYQISNMGNVRSLSRVIQLPNGNRRKHKGRILKQKLDGNKCYYQVILCENYRRKDYQVHRLVANVFCTNPRRKEEVNHIDGNKKKNNANNLEWVTSSENKQHSWEIGTTTFKNRARGEKLSQLTKNQVLEIRAIYESGLGSYRKLAKEYNVGKTAIEHIVKRITWRHI